MGDTYKVFHVVGGGGGHSLKIISLEITFKTKGDERIPVLNEKEAEIIN